MKVRAFLGLIAVGVFAAGGAATAGAASTPTEYVTLTQTSIDSGQTVVAAGPISATGTDVEVNPPGP